MCRSFEGNFSSFFRIEEYSEQKKISKENVSSFFRIKEYSRQKNDILAWKSALSDPMRRADNKNKSGLQKICLMEKLTD
jgi:hypothetical protein